MMSPLGGRSPPQATKQLRTLRVLAIGAVVFMLLFCGAMIGLAVSLARELDRVKTTCALTPVITLPVRNVTCPAANATSPAVASPAPPCTGRDTAADVTFPPRVADVFTPFAQSELDAISAFVRSSLGLADAEPEDMNGNFLYALDFLPENKATVLSYVDGGRGPYPGRSARAIVFFLANPSNASVVEFKVGPIRTFPIPATTPIQPIVQGGTLGNATSIPYLMRPISSVEYGLMEPVVVDAMTTLANLTTASYGDVYDNGLMWWTDSAPRGYTRATRQTWIWFMWYVEGMYGAPIGLQMLIDHAPLNSSDWSIIQLAYNSQGPFATPAELAAKFDSGALAVLSYPRPVTDDPARPIVSSMRRRGPQRPLETRPLPFTTQPGCPRFAVKGSQVSWLSWDLHVGYEIAGGITFNDIRFRGQRVVYELSLQDAYASYSGSTPIQALSQYSDAGWGMGYSGFTLIPGVDCPAHAVFMNVSFFVDGGSKTNLESVCIWEQPEDVAIMRHYDQNFFDGDGFMWVSGTPRTVLVVRTSSTVYNYDYYYSYLFHMDGAIEVHTLASGYLQADSFPSSAAGRGLEEPFATRVHAFAEGSLHDHLFGWKVDIDVLGSGSNSLMRMDTKVAKNFSQPWNFDGAGTVAQYKYNEHTMVAAEGPQSLSSYDPRHPTMLSITSAGAPNAWGVPRGWGLHIPGTAVQLLDDTAPFMPASEWTKYTVAVTQRKESEQRSCRVLYDMQAPGEPLVRFDSFINGESLQNADLVAWVTVGTMHTPTSEDVPVTTTSGTAVRFFIKPLNYFDESPATDLTRSFFTVGVVHPNSTDLQLNTVFASAPPAAAAAGGGNGSAAAGGTCFLPPTSPFDYVYIPTGGASSSGSKY